MNESQKYTREMSEMLLGCCGQPQLGCDSTFGLTVPLGTLLPPRLRLAQAGLTSLRQYFCSAF